MNNFGLRLENLREKHGYSKVEMSEKLGFSKNVYGAYERGDRRPSLETLVKMADIFGGSVDYLIRGKEHPSRDGKTSDVLLAEVAQEKDGEYQSSGSPLSDVWCSSLIL